MHYQLFVEGVGLTGGNAILDTVGMGDLKDPSPQITGVPQGPSGGPGTLLTWGNTALENSYQPEQQDWQKIGDRVWLGLWTDSPPTPKDLKRSRTIASENSYLLGDGNYWSIPVAVRLPRAMRYTDGYWGCGDILPPYEKLWQMSELWYKRLMAIDGHTLPVENGETENTIDQSWMDFLCTALTLNYHVCPAIVGALGLLTTDNRMPITFVILEKMEIEKTLSDLKKTESATAPATS